MVDWVSLSQIVSPRKGSTITLALAVTHLRLQFPEYVLGLAGIYVISAGENDVTDLL